MSEPQPPGPPDPNTAPPAYGQPPAYGSPPQYSGGQYGGMIPGQGAGDPAPMGLRLVARIVDGLLIGAVALLVAHLLGIHLLHHKTVISSDGSHTKSVRFNATGSHYVEFVLVQLLISGLYEVTLLTLRGATLGKMLVGVKVLGLESRELPTVAQAATRWVIPAVPGVVPAVGFLLVILLFVSPFFDPTKRNRGWYDRAAGTIATRAR